MSGKDAAMFAPRFQLEVENEPLQSGISDVIGSVEFESYDGMADMLRLRMSNPGGKISNAKVFQPGNEVSIFGGYGNNLLTHIGRAIIVRQSPNFPQNGIPTLEVLGYSKDTQMMDNEPENSKDRTYDEVKYKDVIEKVAKRYGFSLDIDAYDIGGPKKIIQKTGMTDYELIKGISNTIGYVFWVDGDKDGKWTLHFKDPEKLEEAGVQEKKYTFKYNFGDSGTLLSFRPEVLIKGAKTKIFVKTKDPETGKILKAEFEEEESSPELGSEGEQDKEVDDSYKSGNSIKLYLNDFAFDVVTSKKFKVEAELIHWAQQWFRRMRDNFVLAQGKTVGLENMLARQTHALEGISTSYDGDYYFTKVRHRFDPSGYVVDFGSRKIIK